MIYLSGKITGKDRADYLSEFSYYESAYEVLGNSVINPAKVCDTLPVLTPEQYMKICMKLLSLCDTIVMLPDWENSKGAKEELTWAIDCGKKIEVAPIL